MLYSNFENQHIKTVIFDFSRARYTLMSQFHILLNNVQEIALGAM